MGRIVFLVLAVIIVMASVKSCNHGLDVERALWDKKHQ